MRSNFALVRRDRIRYFPGAAVLAVFGFLALAGCGQTGPLYLPAPVKKSHPHAVSPRPGTSSKAQVSASR